MYEVRGSKKKEEIERNEKKNKGEEKQATTIKHWYNKGGG